MILLENTLVSEAILDEQFICNLEACKGACCVKGDSGAPLEKDEAKTLDEIFPVVEPYLTERGKEAIRKQGKSVIDKDGTSGTPLVEGKECAYTVFENGIAACGIEKAWADGKIPFRKPISCHLYPIRLKQVGDFVGVNYEEWDICKAACKLGKENGVAVFEFCKDSLVRKFGEEWYRQLQAIARDLKK